jgi:hypothetical protein
MHCFNITYQMNYIMKWLFFIITICFLFGCISDPFSPGLSSGGEDTSTVEKKGILSIDGKQFALDGEPFDMWGIRVGSATMNDTYMNHLIDQLDDYKAYGVNTLTVFYMGTSGGFENPFTTDDGRELDPDHHQRMVRIIEEAAERDMVVVVGIFYQRVNVGLKDSDAVREAVRTVARKLQPYRNIIINIANEHNSHWYERTGFNDIFNLHDPQNVIELSTLIHEIDPDRLVGAGGYDHDDNVIIGRSPDVDVLLFDTSTDSLSSGQLYQRFREDGVTGKPVVNVETFGGWTRNWPPGIFPDSVKASYYREIEEAAEEPGLSVFMHNNPWMQGPAQDYPLRYDLAGYGTEDDPGIRWYFEAVRQARFDE